MNTAATRDPEAPDWSFARRPGWIVSHVLVAILILSMIGAGIWQFGRYGEEDDYRNLILEQTREAPVPISELVSPGDDPEVGRELEFRRVELRGTWDLDGEVAIRNRSFDGAPGRWVLTPLRLEDGGVVAVVRGWIAVDPRGGTPEVDRPPFDEALPPDGPTVVTGLIKPTQERGTFGAVDPEDGVLEELSRVDVPRLARQLDGDVYPVWVQMERGGQEPPQPGIFPRPLKLELPDPSQNASYVAQWFIFTTIAIFGYVLILRRQARHQGERVEVPVEDDDPVAPVG